MKVFPPCLWAKSLFLQFLGKFNPSQQSDLIETCFAKRIPVIWLMVVGKDSSLSSPPISGVVPGQPMVTRPCIMLCNLKSIADPNFRGNTNYA
jgi:hypothetical protein